MFICEQCGTQSKAGETPVKVVVETRTKGYYPSEHQLSGKTTVGSEIVREVTICQSCDESNKE